MSFMLQFCSAVINNAKAKETLKLLARNVITVKYTSAYHYGSYSMEPLSNLVKIASALDPQSIPSVSFSNHNIIIDWLLGLQISTKAERRR